jgi:hypothetical protein
MIKRDIVIVDHIKTKQNTQLLEQVERMISATKVDPDMLERLNIRVKNLRKYRGKIERRKEKIKRLYEYK